MKFQKPNSKTLPGLYELIKSFSDEKLMLPISLEELCHRAQGFRILLDDNGKVIASAHLDLFTPELAEIKSLAVAREYQGKGLGKRLVEDCEQEALAIGIKKIFVLTYQEKFFTSCGYSVVDRNTLPEKVYRECVICHFYHNCNEIAMVRELNKV